VALVFLAVIHVRGSDQSGGGSLAYWFPRLQAPALLRNLARVVGARRPLTEGLDAIAECHEAGTLRNKLQRAKCSAESGADCWEALAREGLISRRETAAIHSAQAVDNLPWVLGMLANTAERRQATRLMAFGEIARPIFVVCVGFVVFLFAIGFFMPLVKLLNDLS
jgi:type II secretory pathway component PulF